MNSLPSKLSIELVAKEIENSKEDIIALFEKRLKIRVELPFKSDREIVYHVVPDQIEKLVESLKKYTHYRSKFSQGGY